MKATLKNIMITYALTHEQFKHDLIPTALKEMAKDFETIVQLDVLPTDAMGGMVVITAVPTRDYGVDFLVEMCTEEIDKVIKKYTPQNLKEHLLQFLKVWRKKEEELCNVSDDLVGKGMRRVLDAFEEFLVDRDVLAEDFSDIPF